MYLKVDIYFVAATPVNKFIHDLIRVQSMYGSLTNMTTKPVSTHTHVMRVSRPASQCLLTWPRTNSVLL